MKYSRVYKYIYGEHTFRFRYNFTAHELECVYKEKGQDYEVIWSDGLSEDSWNECKYSYMDMMAEELTCILNMGI